MTPSLEGWWLISSNYSAGFGENKPFIIISKLPSTILICCGNVSESLQNNRPGSIITDLKALPEFH